MKSAFFLLALPLLASPTSALHVKIHPIHQKFREVTVIADNATCPNGGAVLLCESRSYACQDDGTGAQKCLPRDDSFLESVDNSTTVPWAQCSLTNASLPSKCLFDFQCIALDIENVDCYCLPPDAWRTGRGTASTCTTSTGEVGSCDAGKYCRTKNDHQECAPAPYLPFTQELYSTCSRNQQCARGYTCYVYHNFGLCLKGKISP